MFFNLKQLFLLTILAGILVSFCVSVSQKSELSEVLSIAVSPNGKTIATRGTGGVELCDISSGTRQKLLVGNYSFRFMNEHDPAVGFLNNDTVVMSQKDWGPPTLGIHPVAWNERREGSGNSVALQDRLAYEREHFLNDKLFSRVSMNPAGTKSRANFHDLPTGKRLDSEFTTPHAIRHVTTTADGKLAAIVVFDPVKGDQWTELWNIDNSTTMGKFPRAFTNTFSPDDKSLLQLNYVYCTLSNLSDQSETWRHEISCDDAKFSPNGKTVFIVKHSSSRIVQIDVATGKVLNESTNPFPQTTSCFDWVDDNTLVFANRKTDEGFVKYDVVSGQWSRFGQKSRLTSAFCFAIGFVAWAGLWGWIDRRQRWLNQNRNTKEIATGTQIEIEVVPTGKGRLEIAWCLFSIGGVVAIVWSAIPVFYDMPPEFAHNIYFTWANLSTIRLCLSLFGILVGVIALTRGIGKSRNWLRTGAVLQSCNVVNFDLVNLFIGSSLTKTLKHLGTKDYREGH